MESIIFTGYTSVGLKDGTINGAIWSLQTTPIRLNKEQVINITPLNKSINGIPFINKEIVIFSNNIAVIADDTINWSTTGGTGGGTCVLTNNLTASVTVGGVSNGDFFPLGTSCEQMFFNILSPEILPTKIDNNLILNGYTPLTIEVGTSLSFTLGHIYNQGVIDSKDSHPDVDLTGPESSYLYSGDGTVDGSTGVVTHIATLGSNTWHVNLNYSATSGLPYYTSTGAESHIFDGIHLNSGSISDDGIITGYYNYYVSSDTSSLANGGAVVRTYDNAFRTSGSFAFSYNIPANDRYIAFYIEGAERKISVEYLQSSNAQQCLAFVATTVNIPDANGNNVVYTKYQQDIGGVGYSQLATYNITIGGIGSGCS